MRQGDKKHQHKKKRSENHFRWIFQLLKLENTIWRPNDYHHPMPRLMLILTLCFGSWGLTRSWIARFFWPSLCTSVFKSVKVRLQIKEAKNLKKRSLEFIDLNFSMSGSLHIACLDRPRAYLNDAAPSPCILNPSECPSVQGRSMYHNYIPVFYTET